MKGAGVLFVAAVAAGCVATARRDAVAESVSAAAQFDQLKECLVGDWAGKTHEGTDVSVRYSLTAGGSTLVETLFPGTAHEMVTMYHLDNGRLMLTHYCTAGNQPSMVAAGGTGAAMPMRLAFDCAGGKNLKSESDGHMHRMEMVLESRDHLLAEWTFHAGGKAAEVAKFDLRREPAAASHGHHDGPEAARTFVYEVF